ncbi:MAG TPA: trypsin-like peptidase domain-containing protein [Polyangiaceae bacterium]|jgi:S1-C subfamily serine protease
MAATFSADVVEDVVSKISPSIVRVDAGHRFGGTGTAWSSDLVVTASHVVERDEDIEIGLDGDKKATATVVGRDESTNVALLRVSGATLTPVSFRGLDGLRVGKFVVAVARPGKTVRASFGIVSVLGDEFQTRPGARIDRWLETDAAIAAGWSGGVLVDLEDKALGMNNRGLVRHAHLTIPHATLERVVAELSAHGKVRRGYLGVGVHRVALSDAVKASLGRAQEAGALVNAIEPKSHAETAGIFVGDTLVAIDGAKVESPWELASVLRDKVDAEVTIQLVRAGRLETLKAHT